MKALISAFALLTFVAGTTLPVESYAQTTGGGQTMAPDTTTATSPTTSTKKKSSKSHHAKKKSKKPSSQTSSAKQRQHTSIHRQAVAAHNELRAALSPAAN